MSTATWGHGVGRAGWLSAGDPGRGTLLMAGGPKPGAEGGGEVLRAGQLGAQVLDFLGDGS
ncbi:hypothetical protein [Streptomyces canus]|uniref:hypothetical protein n=1 Tax=Streptomyces canus TaxID=58343 RepID=UPI00386CBD02